MFVSRDNPFYFLTFVTHNRLPVFQTDNLKSIACKAIDEARTSSGIKIFAYAIMPDHIHLITDGSLKVSEALRYLKGITARRVIDHLKAGGYETSLNKLRQQESERNYKYTLWQNHSNSFLITTEGALLEKASYVNLNPIKDGLAKNPEDYLYSSFRIWSRKRLEHEPLEMDIRDIEWRAQP